MDTIELQAVARCQAGELAHFTLLYERYLEKVYRFISRRRILQPFKAGDECDTLSERKRGYARLRA